MSVCIKTPLSASSFIVGAPLEGNVSINDNKCFTYSWISFAFLACQHVSVETLYVNSYSSTFLHLLVQYLVYQPSVGGRIVL